MLLSIAIPEYIQVNDVAGNTVALLSPEADKIKDCWISRRLDEEETLTFYLPADSPKLAELYVEGRIVADGREFTLLKPDAVDIVREDNGAKWAKVMATGSWNLLKKEYPTINNDPHYPWPEDRKGDAYNDPDCGWIVPDALVVCIVSGGDDLSGGLYNPGTAAHALYTLLKDTEWTLGIVDVTGTRDLETDKESLLANIQEVQKIWGGHLVWEYVFDENGKITERKLHLRDETTWQPYHGFQIRYAKNLKHITRTANQDIVTRLYPFGENDLDIASVNDGVKYIENFSYTNKIYKDTWKNQEIFIPAELKTEAEKYLAKICKPRYTYRVKAVDLRVLPEYQHEHFELGDMIDVIDEELLADDLVRIVQHRYNVFMPWQCELEVGEPGERLISRMAREFETTGRVRTSRHTYNLMNRAKIDNDVQITGGFTATVVVAAPDSQNKRRADFVVPDGATDAQVTINAAIESLPVITDHSDVATGGTSKTIILGNSASSENNYYIGYTVRIVGGNGTGQSGSIQHYDGATKTATVDTYFLNVPDNTSEYLVETFSGSIVLLEGNYIIDGHIYAKSNTTIKGQGVNTVIKIKDGLSASLLGAIRCEFGRNIAIMNICLDGNRQNVATNNQDGVVFGVRPGKYVENILISNVLLQNFRQCGIGITNAEKVTITSCTVSNCSSGISMGYTVSSAIIGNNITRCFGSSGIHIEEGRVLSITGNTVKDSIDNSFGDGIYFNTTTDCTVTGNVFESNGRNGLRLTNECMFNTISGNIFKKNSYYGIVVEFWSDHNNIVDNFISESSQISDGYYENIVVNYYCDYNNIQGNTLRKGALDNAPPWGIFVANSNCVGNVVTNNDLYDSGKYGGLNDGGTGTVTTAGNRV